MAGYSSAVQREGGVRVHAGPAFDEPVTAHDARRTIRCASGPSIFAALRGQPRGSLRSDQLTSPVIGIQPELRVPIRCRMQETGAAHLAVDAAGSPAVLRVRHSGANWRSKAMSISTVSRVHLITARDSWARGSAVRPAAQRTSAPGRRRSGRAGDIAQPAAQPWRLVTGQRGVAEVPGTLGARRTALHHVPAVAFRRVARIPELVTTTRPSTPWPATPQDCTILTITSSKSSRTCRVPPTAYAACADPGAARIDRRGQRHLDRLCHPRPLRDSRDEIVTGHSRPRQRQFRRPSPSPSSVAILIPANHDQKMPGHAAVDMGGVGAGIRCSLMGPV
jgi:hypothetical protein